MATPGAGEVKEDCMANLDEVAELFAAQGVRVRRLVRTSVRAPEPLIEDACQLAWIRLFLCRERVRRETATAWLVKTAVHEAFKLMRRDRRDLSLDALSEDPRPPPRPARLSCWTSSSSSGRVWTRSGSFPSASSGWSGCTGWG